MKNKIELTREEYLLSLYDTIDLYQKALDEKGYSDARARHAAANEIFKRGGKQVKEEREMKFITNPADVDIDEGNRDLFGE